MKFTQLLKAAKKHPYLLLRMYDGSSFAVNSKLLQIAGKRYGYSKNTKFRIVSYRPITFHQYISIKIIITKNTHHEKNQ